MRTKLTKEQKADIKRQEEALTWAPVEQVGTGRLQRHHTIKLRGKRGARKVLRVKYPYVWHKPWTGERMASRNRRSSEAIGRIEKTDADPGFEYEGEKARVGDVTHVAVNPRPRRRRRRYY